MYKISLLLFVVIAFGIYSCDDQSVDELKMGQGYVDDESGVVLIDTFSLELSTVVVDSIQTSELSSVLVGNFSDEVFGKISSEPAYRLKIPDRNSFDEDDIFDSVTISMYYNNYYIGDTTEVFSMNVMELATNWEDLDQTSFYNVTELDVKEDSLGQVKFSPRPNKGQKLESRLSDVFGQRIFDLFIDDADEIQSTDDFQDYFYGLALQGRSENKAALGFAYNDTSLCLNMYYHRDGIKKEELEATFSIENSTYMFNQIKADRSGTLFAPLVEQKKHIRSTSTDDVTLVQGSSGLMTKVRFPSLNKIFQLVELDQIIKIELILVPTDEADDINDLPTELLMYESNRVNQLSSVYADNSNNVVYLSFNQSIDNYESHPYYSADITDYMIKNLIGGDFDTDNSILVGLPTDYENQTFSTIIFGGEKNREYEPKLNIYTYYY
ncbi:DUF4270 family protein [Saccharicrinis fermentans]|uniref:DUF4270 domain-containing protein n=1 Tax=Saccharicrinis fermentans DSM 9555 = JCM 21142 TaxID=869213 RepID=W7Y020_9BACT|nr:DUF4270 family protein [Saccharicrinis fermentans]GAF04265.1 hypothetical protein JCM21142_72962 [Saccharicrinis fermentans DSM 9555 = JCM 21142]